MPSDTPTYAPMLAGTSQDVPAGEAWRFEIKWDGFRAIARVQGDDVRLWSRNGKALEGKHRSVAEALPDALTRADCVLDGELCAFDEDGVPRFELFQRSEGNIAYVVFDLLELDGEPLIAEPWSRRRERLEELIVPGAPIIVLSQVYDDGAALLDAARRRGLEGIMAKRIKAPYRPGRRSDDWRKIKLRRGDHAADRRLHERPGLARQARRSAARNRRPRIRRQLRQRALGRGHPRCAARGSSRSGA